MPRSSARADDPAYIGHRAGLIEDEVMHDLERDLDIEVLAIILRRGD